jgi:DNA-binding XRE family transcriptional regulator
MANTKRNLDVDPSPFHMGDRIRKARELTKQDRQTFADTIGIHRDTLAKYEETGITKRAALISVAWNTPVRLQWLESGELPWLKEVGPAGFEPATSTVKSVRLNAVETLAIVTPIRRVA